MFISDRSEGNIVVGIRHVTNYAKNLQMAFLFYCDFVSSWVRLDVLLYVYLQYRISAAILWICME